MDIHLWNCSSDIIQLYIIMISLFRIGKRYITFKSDNRFGRTRTMIEMCSSTIIGLHAMGPVS